MRRIFFVITMLISQNAFAELNGHEINVLSGELKRINITNPDIIKEISEKATVLKVVKHKRLNAAEKKMTYAKYRKIFISDKNIRMAINWMNGNLDILEKAEKKYHVDKEIITAILLIETKFGSNMGRFPVLDSVVSRVVSNPGGSVYFVKQIPSWVAISSNLGKGIDEGLGSYAGAFGMPQFMPTSYDEYAVDGDGDGKKDIWSNNSDIIFSVANYFRKHGWQYDIIGLWSEAPNENISDNVVQVGGMKVAVSKNIKVIQRYNSSIMYAMVAAEIYETLKFKDR